MISAQDPIGTICFGYPLNIWYCVWFTALRELTQQFWGCSLCTVPWKNSATITSLGITLQLLISDELWNTPMNNGKSLILLRHLFWDTVIDGSRNRGVSISRVEQTKELFFDSYSLSFQTTQTVRTACQSACRLHASQASRRCCRTSTAICLPALQHRLPWHVGQEAVAVMMLRNVANYIPVDTA